MEYIKKLNFISLTGNEVSFDKHGNVKPKYNIYNYKVVSSCQNCSKAFQIVNVGYWDGNLPQNRVTFYPNTAKKFGLDYSGKTMHQFKSQCRGYKPGLVKRNIVTCCDICDPTSSTECQMCP